MVKKYYRLIEEWGAKFRVPVELIIATKCIETGCDPRKTREEQCYISDDKTPFKVFIGLMETLISSARGILQDDTIDRMWLLEPGKAIRAGIAFIADQWRIIHFDPPKMACAYNAGVSTITTARETAGG